MYFVQPPYYVYLSNLFVKENARGQRGTISASARTCRFHKSVLDLVKTFLQTFSLRILAQDSLFFFCSEGVSIDRRNVQTVCHHVALKSTGITNPNKDVSKNRILLERMSIVNLNRINTSVDWTSSLPFRSRLNYFLTIAEVLSCKGKCNVQLQLRSNAEIWILFSVVVFSRLITEVLPCSGDSQNLSCCDLCSSLNLPKQSLKKLY